MDRGLVNHDWDLSEGTVEVDPEGTEETTPFGRHTVARSAYGDDHYHGSVRLGRFSAADVKHLMAILGEKGPTPDRDAILFLDTETTGMQGGAGTCPFLVGAGHFAGDEFRMVQYFIRDFDEEPSLLYALAEMAAGFRMLVTYNGAAFDLPLLETRFTLARMDNPFAGMAHLDLLGGARRLWRNGHGSCRLMALERGIVGFARGADVPGAMIPRVYFEFLRNGWSPIVKLVFSHNVYDVVSLAALTIAACDRVLSEPAALDEPLDLYSLARILQGTVEWKRSISIYKMALAGDLPAPFRLKAMESLIVAYRRSGNHECSLALCHELIDNFDFSMIATEGAAIYYERIAGDRVRSLEVIEHGLARLDDTPESRRPRALLKSRWERLRQKTLGF